MASITVVKKHTKPSSQCHQSDRYKSVKEAWKKLMARRESANMSQEKLSSVSTQVSVSFFSSKIKSHWLAVGLLSPCS
ncbi:hypothetical protein BC629DRAFT_1594781 [Irpex lacteus]|nr:hypothetical protein BC629DRAFT_1594781 [Irpex lacteus]